jgi:hypothetical protein
LKPTLEIKIIFKVKINKQNQLSLIKPLLFVKIQAGKMHLILTTICRRWYLKRSRKKNPC